MTGDAHENDDALQGPSHLFLVRLWAEDADKDLADWRGRVQMVVNGEIHYFQGTQELINAIHGMLAPGSRPAPRQATPQQAVTEGS